MPAKIWDGNSWNHAAGVYVPPTPPPGGTRHKYDANAVVPLASNKTVLTPTSPGNLGTFSSTTDLLIIVDGVLQQTSGTGNVLSFTGGRNAWIIGVNGGTLRDARDNKTNQTNVLLRQNNYGHTFIGDLYLDAVNAMSVDVTVIRGNAPYGTSRSNWVYPKTYIQNCRIEGSKYTGNFNDPHPDNFQKQTALGNVYFYNVTNTFIYQGYLIAGQSFSLDDPNTAGTQQEQWVEGCRAGGPGYSNTTQGEIRLERTNTYRRGSSYYGPAYWLAWNTNLGNSGFPGENPPLVFFDGDDNWVYGGVSAADTMANGGGLVYPTGLGFTPGSHAYGGATAINSVMGSDARGDYATWVPAAGISGKLREGLITDFVSVADLSGFDSPFAP